MTRQNINNVFYRVLSKLPFLKSFRDEENRFLGNWYYSSFTKDEINFSNNEQYFMWRKQQLFDMGLIF